MQTEAEPELHDLIDFSPGGRAPDGSSATARRSVLEEGWRLLVCAAFAGGVIGFIGGHLSPSWYESTARLAVIPVDDPTSNFGTSAVDSTNATLPMLAALAKSRSLADATVSRLGLTGVYRLGADEARLALLGHVTVSSDRKANLVSIAAEDRLPARARDIAATIAELATQRSTELWAARSHEHRMHLEADRTAVTARLATAEEALRRFREAHHIIDLPEQIKASVDEAAALERQRIDKGVSLDYLRGFGSNGALEVQRAARERRSAEHALSRLRQDGDGGPLLPLDELPALELEHTRLKRAVDVEAGHFELLTQRISLLAAAEARPGGRPELLDAASLPRHRSRPSRTLFALQGAALAALLCAGVLWWRGRRRAAPALTAEAGA